MLCIALCCVCVLSLLGRRGGGVLYSPCKRRAYPCRQCNGNWKLALDLWVSFQRAAQESFPIRASVLLSGEEECWPCWPCRPAAESGGSCESLEILELFSSYYCPARIVPTRPGLEF